MLRWWWARSVAAQSWVFCSINSQLHIAVREQTLHVGQAALGVGQISLYQQTPLRQNRYCTQRRPKYWVIIMTSHFVAISHLIIKSEMSNLPCQFLIVLFDMLCCIIHFNWRDWIKIHQIHSVHSWTKCFDYFFYYSDGYDNDSAKFSVFIMLPSLVTTYLLYVCPIIISFTCTHKFHFRKI